MRYSQAVKMSATRSAGNGETWGHICELQTPEALRRSRDDDRWNRRPPSSAARLEAMLTTVGKTQAKDVGLEAPRHLEINPNMRPTPQNTTRPRQLLQPPLTADNQRTVCVARAHKHPRPTKTNPKTHVPSRFAMGMFSRGTTRNPTHSALTRRNAQSRKRARKPHMYNSPTAFALGIHAGRKRRRSSRVCGQSSGRKRSQTLRAKHSRNKLRTLGTILAETETLPGPATESWTDSVHPDAFSSAAVPNVACEQRFKTPVFVCCAPLSGRYMAQITSDTPTGGPVCTHRMRPPFNPDSG
jgi:hypothetical protein